MITTLLALTVLAQDPAPREQPQVSPASIVSRMFAKYDPAKVSTLVGKIRMTQTAAGKSLTIDTRVQFERPAKLFLHQQRFSSQPQQWYVTSDGKTFTYDAPNNVSDLAPPRLIEPVAQKPDQFRKVGDQTVSMVSSVGEMYSAAAYSIGDRSPVLDVVFGNRGDLVYLKNQWASLRYHGRHKLLEKEVHAVAGVWRENPEMSSGGTYEIYVTDDGDLIRYVLNQTFAHPQGGDAVQVKTVWDADLKVNVAVDPSLFKVIK